MRLHAASTAGVPPMQMHTAHLYVSALQTTSSCFASSPTQAGLFEQQHLLGLNLLLVLLILVPNWKESTSETNSPSACSGIYTRVSATVISSLLPSLPNYSMPHTVKGTGYHTNLHCAKPLWWLRKHRVILSSKGYQSGLVTILKVRSR